jgi:hydroxyacylglutathione hydrolase
MLQVAIVPAFEDNYLWVIHNESHAAVVDPGDARPIIDFLVARGLTLTAILATHHHADHVGGVESILDFFSLRGRIPVYGPAQENIPARTVALREGDVVSLPELNLKLNVLDVPGHTAGHIAYHTEDHAWLFCGDTLFACGCGRLFEGTAKQMQHSLAKLRALPRHTTVYCAHEYTMSNIRFALAVEPDNAALHARHTRDAARREQNVPTVPFTIDDEIATNPFMRWDSPAVIASAKVHYPRGFSGENGSLSAPDLVFGAVREWKNHFK